MQESSTKNDNVSTNEMGELEPVVLAKVSEVTGACDWGGGDDDNIVWGNLS